jgi:hypothetical protein
LESTMTDNIEVCEIRTSKHMALIKCTHIKLRSLAYVVKDQELNVLHHI